MLLGNRSSRRPAQPHTNKYRLFKFYLRQNGMEQAFPTRSKCLGRSRIRSGRIRQDKTAFQNVPHWVASARALADASIHTRTCAGALAHVRAHKQMIYDVLLARGRTHDSSASWRYLCNHEIARRRNSNATSMCICASAPAVWLLTKRWACRGKSTVTRSRKRMGMLLGLSPIPISWRTQ